MARMALAAKEGGAVAIRANTPVDIRAIRAAVELPIIGLYKEDIPGYPVYITPTLDHAKAVAAAGADIIAIDQLAARLHIPLLAEGRFKAPTEVQQALALGATAVVVGAITRPQQITRWFVETIRSDSVVVY